MIPRNGRLLAKTGGYIEYLQMQNAHLTPTENIISISTYAMKIIKNMIALS